MRSPFRLLVTALLVAATASACAPANDDARDKSVRTPFAAVEQAPVPSPSTDATPEAPTEPSVVFARVQFEDTIDDGEVAAMAALPGVTAVRARRVDDGALWSSRRSDGTPVDDLPAEFKVSVSIAVADADAGLEVVPGPGEVVLTGAGAAHREGLDVGGVIELTDRVERTVIGITDEPALQDVEVLVAPEDAASLDLRGRQRALLTLSPDANRDKVTAAVADLLGAGSIVQARVPDGRPFVLSLPATKSRFGEFAFKDLPGRDIQAGASWIEQYVVQTEIPVIGTVVCNRLIIDDLTAVMTDLQESGLASEIDPDLYGGCWAPRRINRNANLSRHAWGIAIDVNVDFDAPGLGPIPSPGVIEAFERHGFRWGGDYPIPDNHHFEWVGTG